MSIGVSCFAIGQGCARNQYISELGVQENFPTSGVIQVRVAVDTGILNTAFLIQPRIHCGRALLLTYMAVNPSEDTEL